MPVRDGAEARPLSSLPKIHGFLGNIKHPAEAPNRRKANQLPERVSTLFPSNNLCGFAESSWEIHDRRDKELGFVFSHKLLMLGAREGRGREGEREKVGITWAPSVQPQKGQNSISLRAAESYLLRQPLLPISWLLQARAQPLRSVNHRFRHVG